MYQVIDDNSIYVTRGDEVYLTVTAKNKGKTYKFQPGDVVRIKVFAKKDCNTVVLQKDFPVYLETETVEIYLDEHDTKIGEVISKPVDYWYEVELNPLTNPQTIIGYDDDGAKVFKLFPEGRDLSEDDPVITPDDIPIVDEALDLTSSRPVQNQAVAKAMAKLIESHNETNKKSDDTAEAVVAVGAAVELERTRIDNLIAHDDITDISRDLEYLPFITEATKAKIDGKINSDGVYATIKVNLREANLVFGGTTMDVFVIPDECRPINTGTIHTEDGLEYIITYDTVNKHYYLSLKAIDTVSVAPSGAGSVTMTYALGDYELKDIRVGADGIIYDTAGKAIREQTKRLTNLSAKPSLYDLNVVREHLGVNEVYKDLSISGKVTDNTWQWQYVSKTIKLPVGTYTVVIRDMLLSAVGSLSIKASPTKTPYLNEVKEAGVYVINVFDDGENYDENNVTLMMQISTATPAEIGTYYVEGISIYEGNITNKTAFPERVLGTDSKIDKVLGKNLFNKKTAKLGVFVAGNGNDAVNNFSSTYYASDYIKVLPSTVYALTDYFIGGACIVFYDEFRNSIKCMTGSNNDGNERLVDTRGIFTTPENCKYLRISGNIANIETNQLEQGDTITEYEEYTEYYPILENKKQIAAVEKKVDEKLKVKHYVPETVERTTLNSGERISIASPNAKNHNTIGFYAKVNTFDKIIVSHGKTNPYCSSYIAIDSTSVNVYEYPSKESLVATYAHGLKISDFINVNIHVDGGFTAKIILTSSSGAFVKEIAWNGSNGDIMVESVGSVLEDCVLTYYIDGLKKDVWLFGDSYFDFWCKNIVGWGFDNFYLDGYSGRSSAGALTSLEKCLTYGKPKKIVWLMGMNNADRNTVNASWMSVYNSLTEICLQNNIELILSTVPNVPDRDHTYKNNFVRNSGFRYLDICNAVGADVSTGWFNGLLGGDKVHPSSNGSVAIANYIANHIPEIL